MPIRITGLNSGLDTEAIISALVSSYNYKTQKYKKAQTKLSWKQDAWKTLNSKIYSLYTGLDEMRFSKNFNMKRTTVSDSTKVSVTASSSAPNGTQKLNVIKMAQAGYLTGGKLADNTSEATTLAELGYTGGNGTINLTKGDGTTAKIEITQGTTVKSFLTSLKEAGVTANYDNVNKRIYVSSEKSGVDNDFTLTGADVDGANALFAMGLSVNSSATEATYESYAKYNYVDYDKTKGEVADILQNVKGALDAYRAAQEAYKKASAQNANMSAAYGYATAYAAMKDALAGSGLSAADQEKLQTLLGMSATDRVNSVMDASGNVYSQVKTDSDLYTTYKDENGNYIQRVITNQGSDGNTYTLNNDGNYVDASGNVYTATGVTAADGSLEYKTTLSDGTDVTVNFDDKNQTTTFYEATKTEVGTGFYEYTDSDKVTYTPNDTGTYVGSDGKSYMLYGTTMMEIDAQGNQVTGGRTATVGAGTEIMKDVYTRGAALSDVKISTEVLEDLKTGNASLTDEFLSGLTGNVIAVKTYEEGADILDDGDPATSPEAYSREDIIADVKSAYATGTYVDANGVTQNLGSSGAAGVTALTNTYAAEIKNNNAVMEDAQETMEEHSVLASIAATKAGSAEETTALNDFVTQVQNAKNILNTANYNSDAKKVDGQDALIKVNDIVYEGSSNAFSINGLNINLQGVTGDGEENAITITTQTDTQGIYDKIKDFLTQYNSLINEMNALYNADTAKGYEPLSDEERSAMSESEIEKWEAKIKDSLLRRDDTLSSVISTMTTAMSQGYEVNGKKMYLSSFGIKTLGYFIAPENQHNAYHIDGDEDDASVKGNEDKLMTAITQDPDAVINFFQQLSQGLYDEVGKKMRATTLSSSYTVYNDKEMASEYSDYTDVIKKWEEKLQAQEDYYYQKFSQMETALAKLNSQSSSLANLLGG